MGGNILRMMNSAKFLKEVGSLFHSLEYLTRIASWFCYVLSRIMLN